MVSECCHPRTGSTLLTRSPGEATKYKYWLAAIFKMCVTVFKQFLIEVVRIAS